MAPSFVLDNSVVMTWCFEDETSDYADAVLESIASTSALVPAIWPLEVVNVLWVAEKKKRLEPADTIRFIELLRSLPIEVVKETTDKRMRDLLGLARSANISSYDASYLDLAMRHGLPLATLDQQLRLAAKEQNVRIFDIENIV